MLNVDELPYLTAEVPGIGGRIKAQPEDFVVEEVPLYQPCGEGTHVYFRVEKTGLSTMRAVGDIAHALGRAPRDIGYAGLKDADAVTTQTFSVEHVNPETVRSLALPRMRVVDVSRHTNKLKLGHLAGNRFTIKIRDVDPARAGDVRGMMETLNKRGVPNYFGPQRFGMRGDTWEVGRALLREEYDEMVQVLLGRVKPSDYGDVRRARELFDQGDLEGAANTWPYPFNNERRVCRMLIKFNGNARKAVRSIDMQLQRFYISAYQSQLFNQIVAGRINRLDRLMTGDLAWRHPQGAVFRVEDVAREQPRCDAFEISPTGPLFGYRMSTPDGEAAQTETALIAAEGMNPDEWREAGRHRVKGARRPLRFQPHDVSVDAGQDDAGPYILLSVRLESGCYATTVLREACKTAAHAAEGPGD
ncbi:MAG: tRNA pseudouridine(13) synthase TruD [Planctomycetes bacterium]|nr:tRNA pseudouridine(13) synthase TruD [Planctomycetota bacterium]